jgi:putative proteasome-type protease
VDDTYFRSISKGWGDALRRAFHSLPSYDLGTPMPLEQQVDEVEAAILEILNQA